MNLTNYTIASDFDGTITVKDSNVLLVEQLGNDANHQLEIDFIEGRISTREAMAKHFEAMPLTMDNYRAFLDNIEISSGFDAFLQKLKHTDVDFYIVSGGFGVGIRHILGVELTKKIHILSNDSQEINGQIAPIFLHENPQCTQSIGPCGNCKRESIENIRQRTGKKIVFIGDGLTDRCAVAPADIVFAKGSLAKFCSANGFDFIEYDTFEDILQYINEN